MYILLNPHPCHQFPNLMEGLPEAAREVLREVAPVAALGEVRVGRAEAVVPDGVADSVAGLALSQQLSALLFARQSP